MERGTEIQAYEPVRGLTFEDVWAALMETRQRQAESREQIDKSRENIDALGTKVERVSDSVEALTAKVERLSESGEELTRKVVRLSESGEELTRNVNRVSNSVADLTKKVEHVSDSVAAMSKKVEHVSESVAELTKNVGGINNSLGLFTESLFSSGLDGLFNEFGYSFTKQGPHVKFKIDGKVAAEADYFLEDGEYAMAVEVKTELKVRDVDEHLQRISVEAIAKLMD